jgi:hypothetical protein
MSAALRDGGDNAALEFFLLMQDPVFGACGGLLSKLLSEMCELLMTALAFRSILEVAGIGQYGGVSRGE